DLLTIDDFDGVAALVQLGVLEIHLWGATLDTLEQPDLLVFDLDPDPGVGLDLLPWPKVDFTRFGEVESKPLSRIKKISGANLHRNWVMIPHVTNCDEADITELEAFRVQLNK
ncbi:2-oxo acid dehydrogenase subunit E2, partial [Mycobacterium tuberculosis]|nr:2-oxo acid dehydrogenase subunit E2 [Mycobacterium tuberculosis]